MDKSLLISNNTYDKIDTIGLNFTHDSGNAYSIDRVYGIINDTIDCQLRAKSRFLGSFVYYWFKTNDYKKNKELSKIKFKNQTIWYNLFFWLCILALTFCVIWGVAIPIINSASNSLSLLQGNFSGVLITNNHIIGYVIDSKTAASILMSITSINDNNYPEWFNRYIDLYWNSNAAIGYNNDLSGCIKFLNDSLIGSGSQTTVSILSTQLQSFIYFSVVGKTATVEVINSWNGQYFENLLTTSYYHGLSANSICLAGNQLAQTMLVPKIWASWFSDSSVIVSLIFVLLLLIIVIVYGKLLRNIKPKLNGLSYPEYIMKKIIFIKKFKFLLNKRVPMAEGIKELNHQILFCSEKIGDSSVYFIMRLLNYIYSVFRDMNLILAINIQSDQDINTYAKIIKQDFDNLTINIINNDMLEYLNSDDATGSYFRYNNEKIDLSTNITNLVVQQDIKDILRIQFKSYVEDFYNYIDLNQKNRIKNEQLNKINKESFKNLSTKDKQEIIKNVHETYIKSETDYIKNLNNKNKEKINAKIQDKFLKFYSKFKKIK